MAECDECGNNTVNWRGICTHCFPTATANDGEESSLQMGNDRMFTLRCRCGKVWYIDSSGERLNDEFQAHVNTHFQKGDWA